MKLILPSPALTPLLYRPNSLLNIPPARLLAMPPEYMAVDARFDAWLNLSHLENASVFVIVRTNAMAARPLQKSLISEFINRVRGLHFQHKRKRQRQRQREAQLTVQSQPDWTLEPHKGQHCQPDPESRLRVQR